MSRLRSALRQVWRETTLNGIAASRLVPDLVRWRVLRLFGMTIENCTVYAGCFFGYRVSIGQGSFVNHRVFVDDTAAVSIGRKVTVAMGVMFCSATHELGTSAKRGGPVVGRPIVVGDGAWIGAGAVILPGVTIGSGSVVAAGSLVRENVAPDTLVAGRPAKELRTLD